MQHDYRKPEHKSKSSYKTYNEYHQVYKGGLCFIPKSILPTEPGDYLLLNTCQGWILGEASFNDIGQFEGFIDHPYREIDADLYSAWAKLPEVLEVDDALTEQRNKCKSILDNHLRNVATTLKHQSNNGEGTAQS